MKTKREWSIMVWKLCLLENKIKESFKNGLISKKVNKEWKRLIGIAWIKIWDFHPDQHPEVTRLFKLHFGEEEKA